MGGRQRFDTASGVEVRGGLHEVLLGIEADAHPAAVDRDVEAALQGRADRLGRRQRALILAAELVVRGDADVRRERQQRFGVEHKHALLGLRLTADVLTLSATPIPRTLHSALLGIRDISNLETPPENRLAVETRLTRWDPAMIRHAIVRELNRDGQIYFVHNRIQDIAAVAKKIERIVPEARITIIHGQMNEEGIEEGLLAFLERRYDILLATTIIESGLDIPNANTIFIDEGDRYGLADLHQLRGRVGRGAAASACVLLYSTGEAPRLSETARERLKAMADTNDGFEIARRDLEIRGPGEFLGARQSGAPLLRFADLTLDAPLLEWARELAPAMLDRHPVLAERHVSRWLGGKSEYLKA